MDAMKQKLREALPPSRRKGLTRRDLAKKAGVKKKQKELFERALSGLLAEGRFVLRDGRLFSNEQDSGANGANGVITKVTSTFGFARPDGAERDLFIPGRKLKGAMPGDVVRLRISGHSGGLPEGEVASFISRASGRFTGVVSREGGMRCVTPDQDMRFPIRVEHGDTSGALPGDKVLAEIAFRGERHYDHTVRIVKRFGSAEKAASCCLAVLAANEIPVEFPDEALKQAEAAALAGIHPKEADSRLDLRGEVVFTIDGADSKDLDDAVSLRELENGWELGVHIADVSYYVPHGSPLDLEALHRGTSVYFADSVVPMLPGALSNGICSLNPGEDRLAFSALMKIDGGSLKVTGARFEKTLIRSRVKGVYEELNALLDSEVAHREKYAGILESLRGMKLLATRLMEKRLRENKLELQSAEGKITVDENGDPVEVCERERGFCERMIEEFMLLANEAAATLAGKLELPFVYRIHDAPSPDRLEQLREVMERLGVQCPRFTQEGSAAEIIGLLSRVEGTPIAPVVNTMVLRSMAKARYSEQNSGHFGLSLKNYAHFTSPIRRYPDLTVHRVLSAYKTGMKMENIHKRYGGFAAVSAERSTLRELAAMTAERDCESCYKAQYMRGFIGREMSGVISGATSHGLYVRLENTVEGLVRAGDMPAGDWEFDGYIAFSDRLSRRKIQLGDTVSVKVLSADVSAGLVGFALI